MWFPANVVTSTTKKLFNGLGTLTPVYAQLMQTMSLFREATIIREATFLEVHVYIKANYPIAKLQFALPQTILK